MLIIPGHFETFRSLKDRSLKLVFETNEPTPEQIADVQQSLMKSGYLAFSTENFSASDQKFLSEIKVDYDDPNKTPSKRLRGVLYRNYEQDNKGYKTFEDYYRSQMEMLIVHFKGKLD